jgi:glyoxylase-like metal-dependent hydrolase (beta-lactamase superfamily II)
MIFKQVGRVMDGFSLAGTHHMPSYVVDAQRPAMFDSGINCLGPRYVRDAPNLLGGRQPEFLFLTHVHFDHCGGASHLKQAFPDLQICASERAAKIMANPRATGLMVELSRVAAQAAQALAEPDDELTMEDFTPFTIDRVLEDGQEIGLGGVRVQVMATPGHTRDFLSYYLPERKILICSEASGCPDITGHISVEFLADYQSYLESQQRLVELDVDIVCPGHVCVFTGEDAGKFLRETLQATMNYRKWVDRLLDEENGEVEPVVRRVKEVEWDHRPTPKQVESAYLINCRARVSHLAGLRAA